MLRPGKHAAFPVLIVLLTFSACMDRELRDYGKSLSDGRYDSEFPSRNASDEIGNIAGSVKKLYSVSHYTTWQFERRAQVLRFHLLTGLYTKMSMGTISTQESVSGSATVMMAANGKVALLTCEHIVNSPDTVITWYDPQNEDQIPFIKSISIKDKQENWVRDLGECGPFVILASDPEQDIAVIGRNCGTLQQPVTVFPYPYGHSGELEWGSFVYIFGYPMGQPVVTKAIVSKPKGGGPDEFTVDALLNKGFSGGLILAIRDGVPHFELVGMVRAVSSDEEYYLRPASEDKKYYEIFPYRGDMFVGTREQLNYGLNFTVPAGAILGFYKKHRNELVREGYGLDAFFGIKTE